MGSSIYDVRTEGGRGCSHQRFTVVDSYGRGAKKVENFVDVING
jgi:hypothetical protein